MKKVIIRWVIAGVNAERRGMRNREGLMLMLFLMAMCLEVKADVLVAWDVTDVDVKADLNMEGAESAYEMEATTMDSHIQRSALSLGFNAPSEAVDIYGFKFPSAIQERSLADAITEGHFIQFVLFAKSGYRFNLSSIEMKGTSGTSGPDDIALMSDVDGFVEGLEIRALTGRQTTTAGSWDTDLSGWGDAIELGASQYQDISSITFRIYGWNSSGTASAGIRSLDGDDLVINGTIEAIPEPAVIGFIGLAGIGALIVRRFMG